VVTFYRRLPKFDYVKPKSLDEALDLLKGKGNSGIRVYAGGTDVIPRLKARLIPTPKILLDLKGISGLDYIGYDQEQGLRIGALASISSVASHPAVQERFAVLAQGSFSIASNQVKNRATVVGNICSAVPSADAAPALLCLGAKLLCASVRGERIIDINDFFTGPRKTTLADDELLKEIRIPDLLEGARKGGAYLKLTTRNRMELALVGVGVMVVVVDGVFREVKIGLGAVAPTPMRAKQAEEALRGEKVGEQVIAEAGRLAAAASLPIDDHRASAEYRRLMVEVLVKRALGQALKA
jgi:carbon-monoxide dehydrogenase medium subunit